MKYTNSLRVIAVCLISVLTFACNQSGKKNNNTTKEKEPDIRVNETTQQSSTTNETPDTQTQKGNPVDHDMDFLKDLNGKYPNDVKLLENKALTERLKKLLGDRYNFLKETWAVETPMEYSNNIFTASACQAHNCGSTNFIIIFDFLKNVMYAGIREEEKAKTYAEDGSSNAKLTDWANGN